MTLSSVRDLLEAQEEALFTHDAEGRLLRVNEPDGGQAPRFFVSRGVDGSSLVRLRHDLPAPLAETLRALVAAEPAAADLYAAPSCLGAVREALARQAPVTAEYHGPCYFLPEQIQQPAGAVHVTEETVKLAESTFPWLSVELPWRGPCFAVVRDGAAVSLCFSARITSRAAEAGVETLPEYRGQGFATTVTRAWAWMLQTRAIQPLYSTTWENVASQTVAGRAGFQLYGADLHLT